MVLNLAVVEVIVVSMMVLDIMGFLTRIGLFYLSAGVIGAFTTGEMFSTGNAATALQWGTIVLSSQDANVVMALLAVFSIISFSLIGILRTTTNSKFP